MHVSRLSERDMRVDNLGERCGGRRGGVIFFSCMHRGCLHAATISIGKQANA